METIPLGFTLLFCLPLNGFLVNTQNATASTESNIQECFSHSYIDPEYAYLTYNYVLCENVTLQPGRQLPIDGSRDNLKYILFENSVLAGIPPGVFNSFSELTQLYLNHSGVKTISPGVFNGLTQLEELYLQENEITEISRGVLNFLLNLKVLNLSRNLINRIESGSLAGLLTLKILNLGHNILKVLNPDLLISVTTLEILDISHNYISKIDETHTLNGEMKHLKKLLITNNTFTTLPLLLIGNSTNLELLDASLNNLTEVDFSLFASPINANYSNNNIVSVKGWSNLNQTNLLDLSENKIKNIHSVDGDIQHLKLELNGITSLGPFMFQAEDLVDLDMSHNLITTIHVNSFYGLLQLNQLFLNNNKINLLPIGCFSTLRSVTILSLSHNLLTNIDYGALSGLSNLTTLYLDHNKLTVIHEKSFHVLYALKKLYLNHNMLAKITAPILLMHLPNLILININDNRWNCGELLTNIQEFKNKTVDVLHGSTVQATNVLGISCINFEANHTDNSIEAEAYSSYANFFIIIIFMLMLVITVVAVGMVGIFYFWTKVPNPGQVHEEVKLETATPAEVKHEKSEIGSLENVYCNLD